MNGVFQGEPFNKSALDNQRRLDLAIGKNTSMKDPYPTDLAEVSLDGISSVAESTPDTNIGLYMSWQRPHALGWKDGRGAKG